MTETISALRSAVLAVLWLAIFATVSVAANFQPVDLSSFYTSEISRSTNRPWSLIPRGAQTLDGVPFLIGGRLEVTGMDAARSGNWTEPRVVGIPVHAHAARLHLLHGAAHGTKSGVPMAQLVLTFASGERRALRLAYGVHARNWLRDADEPRSAVDDPDSTVAWSSPGNDDDGSAGRLRFYKTTFANPWPEERIVRVDFESLFGKATPILFALTLESSVATTAVPEALTKRKSLREAVRFGEKDYVRTLQIRAVDAVSGAALTNASAQLTLFDGASSFFFGNARADAAGRFGFRYPPQQAVSLEALVRAPGMVPEIVSRPHPSAESATNELVVRLAPGRSMGGLVLSTSGQPIPDATVLLHSVRAPRSNDWIDVAWDRALTSTDGRWTFGSAPPDLAGLEVLLSHPDYKSTNYVVTGPALAPEDLFANRATLKMRPQLRFAGSVVDARGRAITNAEVYFRFEEGDRSRFRADARGEFSFPLNAEGRATLVVTAPSFAPQSLDVEVRAGMKPWRVTLDKGQRLAFVVRDYSGRVIEGADVTLDHWNFARTPQWNAKSDAAGRVVWTNAPVGALAFQVSKSGFASRRLALGAPAAKEAVLELPRYGGIAGTVVDAESKEALAAFEVTPGRRSHPDEPWRWDRGNSIRMKRGKLQWSFTEREGIETAALIESPGYVPKFVRPPTAFGWQTNEMQMLRGSGLRGSVVLPDGTPARGASLALVDDTEDLSMESTTFVRTRNSSSEILSSSKQRDDFEFRPRLGRATVFASHPQGFARSPATDVAQSGKVVLQPWGRVRGHVSTNLSRSAANVWIAVSQWPPNPDPSNGPTLHVLMRTRPDSKGNFQFDRVPAGEWNVGLLFRNVDEATRVPPLSHNALVTVKPGETNTVQIGGSGRTLVGRVSIPKGAEDLNWLSDTHVLSLRVPGVPEWKAEDFSRPAAERSSREREQAAAQQKFWNSPAGQSARREQRTYTMVFQTNGTFRAEQVPPGDYTLDLALTSPTLRGATRTNVARMQRRVTVKLALQGEALDLGTLDLKLSPLARPGQLVPDLDVRTLDGRTVRLSDYRGKFLLLDLWDSSVESRYFDLGVLLPIMHATNSTERMELLSLNFDPNEATARAAMRGGPRPWPEAWLGGFDKSVWPALLGGERPDGVVVIDPEGRFHSQVDTDYIGYTLRRLLAPPPRR